MDFNISTGKVHTAVKTVIYGAEGIGKTTRAVKLGNAPPGAGFRDKQAPLRDPRN